ncbi:acyl-CoA dehydrogenase family protein [Streptacidiphilus sp. P02-A3a]|uniref:acyl-CoA dehydrogenase family protein n=1 Tax=Streptacidiphilus sp. P02-A3a TaxID=2704468 RepID=UPI0015FC7CFF|nr:acyl-CoA dehydrogenase family protein [Streptacidiphilus sp. P02-A3a]QMU71816.1 acyl-CoA/acyl-ACP dehydrogenase [Streptacidiphilus sp. P02-A3a]
MNDASAAQPAPLRDLAAELLPILTENAAKVDTEANFPLAAVDALRRSGLFGLMVPVEYGGLGGTLTEMVEVAQVLAGGCLSTAMIWVMHSQQIDSVIRYGSGQLKRELLPRVAAGEVYLASVTTESGSGGHLLTAAESLRHTGTGMEINRNAPIVTGGEYADGFLITMRDAEDVSANQVTLVYVDRQDLEIEQYGEWNTLGMRGTRSVGMRINGSSPSHCVVGERGGYRSIAIESVIPIAHLGWSACWLGAARQAFSDVVKLIRSPRRPSSIDPNSPLVAARLARIRMDLELVSGYLNRVLGEVLECRSDGRSLDTTEMQIHINTLKVAAAERTFSAVDGLIQLAGVSVGYSRSSSVPLERHFRDLRSASLNFSNDRMLVANGALSLMDRKVTLA